MRANLAIATMAVDLGAAGDAAPASFRLMPIGLFRSDDGSGRPKGLAGWRLDEPTARRIAAGKRGSLRVIDYEHQTLLAADNGQPAPAAGWIGGLEVRPDGLYANAVEWTARAAALIASREYRYISPVFSYDRKTGEVRSVHSAALTNTPALDGLTDLAAQSQLASFLEEKQMNELMKALGLAEDASEAQALDALAALRSRPPDPARWVEVSVLAAVREELATAVAQLRAMTAERTAAEIDQVIQAALSAGKLTPATVPHAKKLAEVGLAALKDFIAAQPAIVTPESMQSGGRGNPDLGEASLTDEERYVCTALGITGKDLIAHKRAIR
jgi:phage I-like protein